MPLVPGLAAAALVEAGAGVAAAGCLVHVVEPSDNGDFVVGIFVAGALAAGLVDVVLLPGWVWGRDRFAVVPVLARLAIAAVMLALAVVAGGLAALLLISVSGVIHSASPVRSGLGAGISMGLLVAFVFAAAGATVGLGAALAQVADHRPGPDPFPRGRTRSHVLGGITGVFLVLGVTVAAAMLHQPFRDLSPLYMLPALPLALVLGGLPHNLLVLRDAVRRRDGVLDLPMATSRAALCATILFLVGAGLLLTAP